MSTPPSQASAPVGRRSSPSTSRRSVPDDVVLVTAAAGGIGSLLVQAAGPHLGATVIGLAGGPEKVALVRSLGVDSVDYLIDGWTTEVADLLDSRSPTVLVDGVGGAIGTAAASLVAKGGRVVRIGYSSGSFGADSDMLAAAGRGRALGRRTEGRPTDGPGARVRDPSARCHGERGLDAVHHRVRPRRCRALTGISSNDGRRARSSSVREQRSAEVEEAAARRRDQLLVQTWQVARHPHVDVVGEVPSGVVRHHPEARETVSGG
ncbi:MAG: zinc-binding dehydrogenase [Ilumatobacteraceae bacterium]